MTDIVSLNPGETDTRTIVFATNQALERLQKVGTGGTRNTLLQSTTFFADVENGNDGNTGTSSSSGSAWKTIQHAIDTISNTYDLAGQQCLIQCADGIYPESLTLKPYIGRGAQGHAGPIQIQGNAADATKVTISSSAGNCVTAVQTLFEWDFANLTFTAPNGFGILADASGWVNSTNVIFGPCSTHASAENGGICEFTGGYTINGNAQLHLFATAQGKILYNSTQTITIGSSLDFSIGFAFADALGIISCPHSSVTITTGHAVSGQRYSATNNSVINTIGGGANYFPGSATGTTTSGGIYA